MDYKLFLVYVPYIFNDFFLKFLNGQTAWQIIEKVTNCLRMLMHWSMAKLGLGGWCKIVGRARS